MVGSGSVSTIYCAHRMSRARLIESQGVRPWTAAWASAGRRRDRARARLGAVVAARTSAAVARRFPKVAGAVLARGGALERRVRTVRNATAPRARAAPHHAPRNVGADERIVARGINDDGACVLSCGRSSDRDLNRHRDIASATTTLLSFLLERGAGWAKVGLTSRACGSDRFDAPQKFDGLGALGGIAELGAVLRAACNVYALVLVATGRDQLLTRR